MGTKINETKKINNQNNGSFWSGAYIDPRQSAQQHQQDDPEIVKHKEQLIESAKYLAENLDTSNSVGVFGFTPVGNDAVSISINKGIITISATLKMKNTSNQQPPYTQPYWYDTHHQTVPYGSKKLVACHIVNNLIVCKKRTGSIPRLDQVVPNGCSSTLTVSEAIVNFVDTIRNYLPIDYDINTLYHTVYNEATSCIDHLIDLVKNDTNMYTVHLDGTVEKEK